MLTNNTMMRCMCAPPGQRCRRGNPWTQPDLSEEVATDCIAAQIEDDGEFCIEDVDGLDSADGEYEVFVMVTMVERP